MKTVSIKKIDIGQGLPKICVPLMGDTDEKILCEMTAILEAADEYNVDIIEFRGDYYKKLNDLSSLRSIMEKLQAMAKNKILLFTIRSEKEGGEKLAFTSPAINEINRFVIENGLGDIVDVELMSGEKAVKDLIELAHKRGVRIIMSYHNFHTTPSMDEMVNCLVRMQKSGADIAKIAVMPNSKEQVLELLKATRYMQKYHPDTPVVAISMGTLGALSRVTGEIFGSAITFATLGAGSAPGQLSAKKVKDCLELIDKYFV